MRTNEKTFLRWNSWFPRLPACLCSGQRHQQLRPGGHEGGGVEEDQEAGDTLIQCPQTQEDFACNERLRFESNQWSIICYFLIMSNSVGWISPFPRGQGVCWWSRIFQKIFSELHRFSRIWFEHWLLWTAGIFFWKKFKVRENLINYPY